MALTGMDADAAIEAVAKTKGASDSDVIELWSEIQPAVELALACASHLQTVGGGFAAPVVVGFDRSAVDVTARWMDVQMTPDLLNDLRVLEAEMAAVFNERSAS